MTTETDSLYFVVRSVEEVKTKRMTLTQGASWALRRILVSFGPVLTERSSSLTALSAGQRKEGREQTEVLFLKKTRHKTIIIYIY